MSYMGMTLEADHVFLDLRQVVYIQVQHHTYMFFLPTYKHFSKLLGF